jgi:hypothetical protein
MVVRLLFVSNFIFSTNNSQIVKGKGLDIKDYFIIAGIITAAILAGAYSVYQYIDGIKKDRGTSELNKKLVDAQTKALQKAEELINAQKETQALARKLEIANEEIRKKTCLDQNAKRYK